MGVFVNDTFTETSDTTLASHTGETGAIWTLHTSYTGSVLDNASLDRIYLNSAAAAAYYASGTPSGADYSVQADFYRLSSMSINLSIAIGMDTSADTMIILRLNDNAIAAEWQLIDRVAGSNTQYTQSVTSIPSIGGAPVTAKLVRTGTALTVFLDGVQDTSLNATTSITAISKPGFRASGQATSTTGIHIDNFRAEESDGGGLVLPYFSGGHSPYRRIVRVSSY